MQSQLFQNFSELRRRNIRSSRNNSITFSYDITINSLIEAHISHLNNQNQSVSNNQKIQMYDLIYSLVKSKKAIIQGAFIDGDLKYIVCYAFDDISAYFLFGAPIGDNDFNFLGTASHFNMCNYLKSKNIKQVNLEGVNSPDRGKFKLSLGGELIQYFSLRIN